MLYIPRIQSIKVLDLLQKIPCIGLIGPRQCGKSTLVKNLGIKELIYLDLESREDLAKIGDPGLFFMNNSSHLICLDEVQRLPDIFIDVKAKVDKTDQNGQFILLGSASPALLKQSSESLAGRVIFLNLSGFLWPEIKNDTTFNQYLFRGGFPRSILATDDATSQLWLESYIRTFFERDLLDLSPGISQHQVSRLFSMLAHVHGQELNVLKLSKSLELAYNTIKKYIDTLIASFQLFIVPAYTANHGKRLVKSPKLYLSDTGILHYLLGIDSYTRLLAHPVYGFSFEGLIIQNIMALYPMFRYSFYKTSHGEEIDLILEGKGKRMAIEIKATNTPVVNKGFYKAQEDIKCDEGWIIALVPNRAQLKENVFQTNLDDFLDYLSIW